MAVKTPTKTTAPAKSNGKAKATPAKKQWVFLFNDEKGVSKVAKTWQELRELLGGSVPAYST